MTDFLYKMWILARPYRARLVLGILTGIVSGLMECAMIATIGLVYTVIFPTPGAAPLADKLSGAPTFVKHWLETVQDALTTGIKSHPLAVLALVALIPAVMFFRGVFSYLNAYLLQWTSIRLVNDLRIRLFEHVMNLSASFFNQTSTGELMSRISSDTGTLQSVITNITSTMVKDPVTLVSLLGYLLWTQPGLTLVSMVVLPLCMIPIVVYSRKVRRSSSAIQTHHAEMAKVMVESFTGTRIVKAYNLEDRVVQQFRSTVGKFIGHYMRIVRSSELPGPLLEFLGSIGVSLVLIYLAFRGGVRATSGDFLTIVLAIFSMYRPMKSLTRLHSVLEQARAASERVFELLEVRNNVPEPGNPKALHAAGAAIEFKDIQFAYGEKVVLQNIQLTVKPGQLVALVGSSGSGKTTLTNLLLRFFDPQQGAITIGGIDIREVATRDLRNQIAVVTQETVLFNESIRENIALGRPGTNNGEIEAAARHAFAHDFIMEKEKGYETVIGEKGVLLSGGQRQRLAIARAILKDAPILVLDEATSALDTEAERIVQAALEELMKGRTTICIAHRLSTIHKADLIVVLERGRIVETGYHTDLIKRGGIYQKLYELQFRG